MQLLVTSLNFIIICQVYKFPTTFHKDMQNPVGIGKVPDYNDRLMANPRSDKMPHDQTSPQSHSSNRK